MSPGTYLRCCRLAAGLSLEDVAFGLSTTPPTSARNRAEILALYEGDVLPPPAGVIDALADLADQRRSFAFDRVLLEQLIARREDASAGVIDRRLADGQLFNAYACNDGGFLVGIGPVSAFYPIWQVERADLADLVVDALRAAFEQPDLTCRLVQGEAA